MANFFIMSNNPLAKEKYAELVLEKQLDVEGIFKAARDEIHLGSVLINHPLSGSVKPNESPFKSLVLSTRRGDVDMKSLQLIEGALEVLKKLGKKVRKYPNQALEDFKVIDLDLLDSAMLALPAEFYR